MPEVTRLDEMLSRSMDAQARQRIWSSVRDILARGPAPGERVHSVGLALGYVQSGKTTSITALAAEAADAGYQVILALLGSTNLLLDQNRLRLEAALEISTRADYVWVSETNPTSDTAGRRLADYVKRGRTCLVPVLKHAGRIRSVAAQLGRLPEGSRVLIIDDEADQGSLNTSQDAESKTYAAIKALRDAVPSHLYVQYTATPYAPLLLDAADALSPEFVEFLLPGEGYTGGKEFFVDNAERVVRNISMLDEQASKTPPLELQKSLSEALASFFAGAALLLVHDETSPPISMLVHSTARNDVQARYEHLIRRRVEQWRAEIVTGDITSIPSLFVTERHRLARNGVQDISDDQFVATLELVLSEATIWLVNSTADINRVDWHVAPIHILIGGNKLDRGFTVEGLTVTYMNRPTSKQIDTLEQRARAFGYRSDLLPYCQFFASRKTVRSLTEIVHTEEDLRIRLREHIESGGSVHTWAHEIGLLLPEGMAPTRASVVRALSTEALGWHSMRMPSLDPVDTVHNRDLLREIGLFDAPRVDHGRLQLQTLRIEALEALEELLTGWHRTHYSPGWQHEIFIEAISRNFKRLGIATLLLMEDGNSPRTRRWEEGVGFINLFQGRDNAPQPDGAFYPGDRNILNLRDTPDQIVIQAHRTVIRGQETLGELLPLALYLGSGSIVRRSPSDK